LRLADDEVIVKVATNDTLSRWNRRDYAAPRTPSAACDSRWPWWRADADAL
jgi:hypothetical protein